MAGLRTNVESRDGIPFIEVVVQRSQHTPIKHYLIKHYFDLARAKPLSETCQAP